MIAKLRRIAIYDTANDKVVTLTTIQEGVEGSGGFFYEEEEDTLTVDDDQSLLLSFLCKLEARVLGNSSVRADLEAMVGEECIISGVGIDGFVQFGRTLPPTSNANTFADTVKIVAVDQVDKSTVFRIVAQRRSVKGYSSGIARGGVGAFNSLLNMYEVTSGTGGLLYGFYGATIGATYTITNTTSGYAFQNISAPRCGGHLLRTIPVPIRGHSRNPFLQKRSERSRRVRKNHHVHRNDNGGVSSGDVGQPRCGCGYTGIGNHHSDIDNDVHRSVIGLGNRWGNWIFHSIHQSQLRYGIPSVLKGGGFPPIT